jgi:hypothetical protein
MSTRWFPAAVTSLIVVWVSAMATYAQNPVSINVDAQVNRHPINPNVYGVAHASTATLNDLNSPLNRNGGNNTTRYNWQLNADNRGNDWSTKASAIAVPPRRTGRYLLCELDGGERPGDAHDAADRLGREGGHQPNEARRLLDREVRRANRQRLAMDA